jgi:hypothetical protein
MVIVPWRRRVHEDQARFHFPTSTATIFAINVSGPEIFVVIGHTTSVMLESKNPAHK